mmetsp:Transcript_2190/g.3164  ORF Transcript_2190/g.3164 Transcript_2190/m.3164 type:complete len:393 (+) Transcript_2190:106-1284(+)
MNEDVSSQHGEDISYANPSISLNESLTPSNCRKENSRDSIENLHVLQRIPNTAFGIRMGLAGNAVLWKSAGRVDFLKSHLGSVELANGILWHIALVVAVMTLLAYLYKMVYHFRVVVMEYRHPVRVHFFNAPHLILIMLSLGVPSNMQSGSSTIPIQILFAIGLIFQFCITQVIYERWMFCNQTPTMSEAKPQFFLSIIGWFLLTVLGNDIDIDTNWGISISSFCFGIGCFMYVVILVNIFNGLSNDIQNKGSPALTLLIAPPSVASIAIDGFAGNSDESNVIAQMALGWSLMVFTILIRLSPRLAAMPTELGTYWAYVFPMASLSSACLNYTIAANSGVSQILAIISIVLATLALCIVFSRLVYHILLCWQHKARWGDSLLGIPSNIHSHN